MDAGRFAPGIRRATGSGQVIADVRNEMKYFGVLAILSLVVSDFKKLQTLGVTPTGFAIGAVGLFISLIGVDLVLHYNDLKADRTGAILSLPARLTLSIASLIDPRLKYPSNRMIGYFGVIAFYLGLLLGVCGCIFL